MTGKVRKTFTPSTLKSIEKIVRTEFHNALHNFEGLNFEFHRLVQRQTEVKRAIGSLAEIVRSFTVSNIARVAMEENLAELRREARTNSERITGLEAEIQVARERKYTASVALCEMEKATENI